MATKNKNKPQKYFVPPPAPFNDLLPRDEQLAEVRAKSPERWITAKSSREQDLYNASMQKVTQEKKKQTAAGENPGTTTTTVIMEEPQNAEDQHDVEKIALSQQITDEQQNTEDRKVFAQNQQPIVTIASGSTKKDKVAKQKTNTMILSGGGSGGVGGVILRQSQDALLSVARLIEKGVQMTDLPADAVFSLSATPRGDAVTYSKIPKRVICPFCGCEIITQIVLRRNHLVQNGMAAMLCASGCCCCACAPFFCNSFFEEVAHACPACMRPIADAMTFMNPGRHHS